MIFVGQTNRNPQMVGHTVQSNRANNDTLAQQCLVNGRRIPRDLNSDKVTCRWNVRQSQGIKTGHQLIVTITIDANTASQVIIIIQYRQRGGQCWTINVEGLAKTIEDICCLLYTSDAADE